MTNDLESWFLARSGMSRSLRERLALISGVDLEQLDGLGNDDDMVDMEHDFEPNLARLVS